jgi:hypothetical protein
LDKIRCRRALKNFSKKCKISLTKCKVSFTLHIGYVDWFGIKESIMNRAQKIAWFNLIVVEAGAAAVVILAAIGVVKLAVAGLIVMGGLVGMSPLLFWKRRGHVEFDERDQLICARTTLVATSATCGYFLAMCIMPLFTMGPKGCVPVGGLVGIAIGGVICFVAAKSLNTLLQYGWGGKGEKS